ncbi:hypothetical protein [Nonomuraea rubra]|uniref:hypothetical protein n=1 Tax=Nonomuraea rubra TaxID=46180 RepID=UPI0031F08E5B
MRGRDGFGGRDVDDDDAVQVVVAAEAVEVGGDGAGRPGLGGGGGQRAHLLLDAARSSLTALGERGRHHPRARQLRRPSSPAGPR